MTRGKLSLIGGVTLAALVAVAAASRAAAPQRPHDSPIQHIVIVFQENHSFDDVLGKLCVIDARCDGATTGSLHDGTLVPLAPEADLVPDVDHTVQGQRAAIDQGKMDGFDLLKRCDASTGYACYTQLDPAQIPNLAALARTFVISDRTFEFATAPSWAGHLVLASATLDGFLGSDPRPSKFTPHPGPGWGCDSNLDASWWNGKRFAPQPACIPDQSGQGPYRKSLVPYVPTIFDRVEEAGLSWSIYGGSGGPGQGYLWTICPTFYECLSSSQRANFVPASSVIAAARDGTLPNVSIVTPIGLNSQHNNRSMAQGDNWIGQVVGAIMGGPDWSSTAIFITYDDCGCFYDHVPPPSGSFGIREPMVIVSPYARAGYTDSTDATFLSILAYAEHTLGLAPLNQDDASAYDYANAFDYTQRALEPIRMTRTNVPEWERAWIAAHPLDSNDPT